MTVTPFAHQLEAVERARVQRKLALYWEPGLGKTIGCLLICRDRPMLTLVVCPKAIMSGTWEQDTNLFDDLEPIIWHGTPLQRERISDSIAFSSHPESLVVITTFDLFRANSEKLEELGVRRFIVDESSKMKDRTRATAKTIIQFCDKMEEVYLLSGTPAPNGPEEYYTQVRAIYGPTVPDYWSWTGKYMNQHRSSFFVPGGRGRKREKVDKFTLKRPDEFAKRLERMAVVKKKVDCLDMPEKIEQVIPVKLSPVERGAFNNLVDDLVTVIEGEEFEVHSAALSMKLRQIAGGNVRKDEIWRRIGAAKLVVLRELVESLAHAPFLVWTQFHPEADRVSELLTEMEIEHRICDGRTDSLQWNLHEFVEGDVQALVCHPQSVGHGCTFVKSGDQWCTHAIYYSLSYSYELHTQSMDRIHRIGQQSACTYMYLIAEDTLDDAMLGAIGRKGSVSDAVLNKMRAIAFERMERCPSSRKQTPKNTSSSTANAPSNQTT